MQDDFENELKDLREYDLSYEKIKVGVDKIDDGKFIVLANHKGVKPKAEEGSSSSACISASLIRWCFFMNFIGF